MTTGTLNELWNVYSETFRLHSHQLLVWAHGDIRSRLNADIDEPAITGLLAEAMKLRLDHPLTPEEYLHYTIGDQVPISPSGQLGNDRLRLDISVIRSGVRPRLSYIFEAKRLQTGAYTIGKYVGEGGIGDFIACRYASDYPEAAMIGLLQNKDFSYWHSELHRTFDDDRKSKDPHLGIHKPLKAVSVLPGLGNELVSQHIRKNKKLLDLFHIFLDCS
jgi:hypothetical protein